jgi:chromosome segregation ATPase
MKRLRAELASRPTQADADELRRLAGSEDLKRKKTEAALRNAQDQIGALREQVSSLGVARGEAEKQAVSSRDALKGMEEAAAELKSNQSRDLAALRRALDQARTDLAKAEHGLAQLREAHAQATSERQQLENKSRLDAKGWQRTEEGLRRQIEQLRAEVRRARGKLASVPERPLSDEAAKSIYLEGVGRASALTSRADRIAAYREMALELVGTPYGSKAAWLWRRELRASE